TTDQHTENNTLLENEEIEEIVAKLLDETKENNKLIGQEDEDKDEVPDLLVVATEAYDTMQTIICYEEQESSESNLSFEELEFLRKLLKKYKYVHEKSKKQTKITSFFNLQDSYSYSQDSSLQDLYFQDPYSQDLYFQNSYS
ncbi:4589_t:CDS:2, partial [Dentiscutata heterogama]